MEGGLTQIYMGIWLERNGLKFNDVQYVNVIMDDAVGAMVSGQVAAGELWEPFASKVLQNLKGSRYVTTSAEPFWKGNALLGDGMYMTEAMIKDKPALAGLTLPARSTALAVTVWAPADSMKLVIDQVPAPLAVALPSAVVPSVS